MGRSLEYMVDSTTDVQEACQMGFVKGYEAGYSDGVNKRVKGDKICISCGESVSDDKYYILSAVKVAKDLPPIESKVTYCSKCFSRLCRFVNLLEEA